jgi:hypothetical protein
MSRLTISLHTSAFFPWRTRFEGGGVEPSVGAEEAMAGEDEKAVR